MTTLSRSLPGAGQRSVTSFVRRRPLSAFFLWFFTVGQALAFTPLLVDVPVSQQWFVNAATVIGLLLPALVITRIVDGPEGLRALGRRIVKVRAPLWIYAVGLVVLPLLAIAIALALLGAPEVPASTLVTAVGTGFILGTVVGFVLNNLWEEVAWMGFVQARLQARRGPMLAAVLTAPLFMLQHVSMFLGNELATVVIIMVAATAVMILYRAFNAWLYNRTGASLFLVGLVHAAGNAVATGNGFGTSYLRQLYPDNADLVGVLHMAAFAVLGLVVIAATRGRLGISDPRTPTTSRTR